MYGYNPASTYKYFLLVYYLPVRTYIINYGMCVAVETIRLSKFSSTSYFADPNENGTKVFAVRDKSGAVVDKYYNLSSYFRMLCNLADKMTADALPLQSLQSSGRACWCINTQIGTRFWPMFCTPFFIIFLKFFSKFSLLRRNWGKKILS